MGKPRLYTDEERKLRHRESSRKCYKAHKDKYAGYFAKHYKENKNNILEYQAEYFKTPMGRAQYLVQNYKRNDKKYNRGECTLTAQWVVDNIFPKPCHYCGETGWEIMGCDRIDNSLPHTHDNVVPCCRECNLKRQKKDYESYLAENDMFK